MLADFNSGLAVAAHHKSISDDRHLRRGPQEFLYSTRQQRPMDGRHITKATSVSLCSTWREWPWVSSKATKATHRFPAVLHNWCSNVQTNLSKVLVSGPVLWQYLGHGVDKGFNGGYAGTVHLVGWRTYWAWVCFNVVHLSADFRLVSMEDVDGECVSPENLSKWILNTGPFFFFFFFGRGGGGGVCG